MVAPLKYIVIVGEDGKVTIDRTSLPPGVEVEVTVEQRYHKKLPTPSEQGVAFKELQQRSNLSKAQIDEWLADMRTEREGFGP